MLLFVLVVCIVISIVEGWDVDIWDWGEGVWGVWRDCRDWVCLCRLVLSCEDIIEELNCKRDDGR